MKNLLLCLSIFGLLNARPMRVSVFNKSNETIRVSFNAHSSGCEKVSLKPRQSKLFPAQDIAEMQSGSLTIENSSGYWPQQYELKFLEPAELVLKQGSLIISRKVVAPHPRPRRTNSQPVKRAAPAIMVKIAYYGKNGSGKNAIVGQEIGFM